MAWVVVAILVAVAGVAIYLLVLRVSAQGGTSDRDATDIVDQALGEADAFRGSRSSDYPAWDGQNRLAPPTQEGSMGGVG